ncbi:MAG: hypothetical protein AB8B69_04435 [Chitinophagales bacterium]
MIATFKQQRPSLLIGALLVLSFIAYYLLAYYTLRTEVYQVFSLFGVLFLAYGLLYKYARNASSYHLLLVAAVLFRVLLLFVLPNLSDDFYRFNWDGRLLGNGISPFAGLPIHFMDGTFQGAIPSNITPALFEQLNSPKYFTIYPPVCQFIFWLGCLFFPNDLYGATVVMKTCLLCFEVGSIFLLHRMVQKLGLQPKKVLLYALNPLVIVELTGNLHFEAAMIFFILLAIYFLMGESKENEKGILGQWIVGKHSIGVSNRQWIFSATAMGLGIASKLIPMIFLPLLIRHIGWKKSILYGAIAGIVSLAGFVPLFTFDILQNLFSSIGLYFQKFEFNASIYYLNRSAGYYFFGYNIVETAGKNLALFTIMGILVLAFWRRNMVIAKSQKLIGFDAEHIGVLIEGCLFALLIYFALANIVHPWYVSSLVALCVFTPFRFPILWSGMAVLTYYTYLTDAYTENLYLVALEYVVVYGYLIWELRKYFLTAIQKNQSPL